jgi:MFS superfamily sulfate permease-like transporter
MQDFCVLMATSIITLIYNVDKGIYAGVALSIFLLFLQSSFPDLKTLGR